MREFATAVRDANEPEEKEPLEFKLNNEVCTAHFPGDGQIMVLMAMSGSKLSTEEQVAGVIDFFFSCLDESDHPYVYRKLLDRNDDFGPVAMQDIMKWWIEEWSGRPTVPSPTSTPSRKPAGQKSTRRTPASISSGSPSTGS